MNDPQLHFRHVPADLVAAFSPEPLFAFEGTRSCTSTSTIDEAYCREKMDHNSSSGSSKMKEYLCPHCGGNFRSGPGLCSHEKARLAKDGVCGDSRRGDWT